MKTIITEKLHNEDDGSAGKMYLVDINDDGHITKLTFNQWKANTCRNDASELTKGCFLTVLLSQTDRFSLMIDFNKFVKKEDPSFTQKVEWLLSEGGCLYTKRGLTY